MNKKMFKYIELELYEYPDTVKEINMIRDNIINQSEFNEYPDENIGAGRSNSITSTVELAVTRLATDKRLNHLEEMRAAISSVFNQSDPLTRDLIELKYWTKPQLLTFDGIAANLHISRRTAIRYRDNFVEMVAEKLGYK